VFVTLGASASPRTSNVASFVLRRGSIAKTTVRQYGQPGLSPAAASYITGFAMTRAVMMWTSPEVVGGIFAADKDPTTPVDLTTAVADMHSAYEDAAGRPTPTFLTWAMAPSVG
jgi:hypothetical protein